MASSRVGLKSPATTKPSGARIIMRTISPVVSKDDKYPMAEALKQACRHISVLSLPKSIDGPLLEILVQLREALVLHDLLGLSPEGQAQLLFLGTELNFHLPLSSSNWPRLSNDS